MGDSLGNYVIVALFIVEVAAEWGLARGGIQQLNKILGPMSESILIIILKRGSILQVILGIA